MGWRLGDDLEVIRLNIATMNRRVGRAPNRIPDTSVTRHNSAATF